MGEIMKTWVLILFKNDRDIIIGGYPSEQQAFDAGLEACRLIPVKREEIQRRIAGLQELLRTHPGDERTNHWNKLLVPEEEALKFAEDPLSLLKRFGSEHHFGSYGSYFERGGHSPYSHFDVIPGAASQ